MPTCMGCEQTFNPVDYQEHRCDRPLLTEHGYEYRQCHVCKAWIGLGYQGFIPEGKIHVCVVRKDGEIVDVTNRRWDHKLNAWVLEVGEKKEIERWNATTKQWEREQPLFPKKEESNYTVRTKPKEVWDDVSRRWIPNPALEETKGTEYSSCELPTRVVVMNKQTGVTEEKEKETRHKVYTPVYPWDGVDAKKWRNTYLELVTMYHRTSWWKETKYISEEDWKARLAGEYRPEGKSTIHYSSYYNDWENYR